jgi:hypothetical protein
MGYAIDSIQSILISIVFLETAIIFGDWINSKSQQIGILQRNEDCNSSRYGFKLHDCVQLLFYGSFMLFSLYMIFFYALPLHASVSNLMTEKGVDASLPYISFTMSFIAISITMLIFGFNLFSGVFSRVHERNRYRELHQRLDNIDQNLSKIESKL